MIKYNSENVLPKEIDEAIRTAKQRIERDKYEYDKIYLHVDHIRSFLINWFASNEIIPITRGINEY
jgi:hypothetical protein